MKWKMLRKMMKVGTAIYGLECRDGYGVRDPLNDRERVRLRKLRRYYDGHRLHREYQLIMSRRWDRQIERWAAKVILQEELAQSSQSAESSQSA